MNSKHPNSSTIRIIAQLLLAVAYVALMRQLLAFEAGLWGEGVSGVGHVFRMSLGVAVDLTVILLVNYMVIRAGFYRLGLLIGVAIFGYYYIYNPYGHNYILLYLSILRSPPHLVNMLLLVVAPALVGKFIDIRSERAGVSKRSPEER